MTAQYQRFVEGIAHRAELPSAEEARQVAIDVVEAVAAYLDGVDRQQFATALPTAIRDSVRWDQESATTGSQVGLVRGVAAKSGLPPERGRYLVQAVLSEIVAEDPSLAELLRHRLADELEAMFEAPGEGPPPEWSAAGPDDRPRPLDSGELSRALTELADWSGTPAGIRREVGLPRDRWRPLKNRVKAAEAELSHHASIEEGADGIVFSLRTRSLEAVTELDLQLARRIDEAVTAVSSGV